MRNNRLGSLCLESLCLESLCPESLCLESLCPESLRLESLCLESLCLESLCLESLCLESLCLESLCLESLCLESLCLENLLKMRLGSRLGGFCLLSIDIGGQRQSLLELRFSSREISLSLLHQSPAGEGCHEIGRHVKSVGEIAECPVQLAPRS